VAAAFLCVLGAAGGATVALTAGGDSTASRSVAANRSPVQTPLRKARPRAVEPLAGEVAGATSTTTVERPAAPPPTLSERDQRALGLLVPSGRLYVQGDSLMVGTDPYLRGLLPSWSVVDSVKVGRSLPQGVRLLRQVANKLPPVVIIGLGTNDDANYPSAFESGARAVMGIAGPRRCVVWVDVYRPLPGDHYDRFNKILTGLQSAYRNLLVAKWSSLAARHPEWFSGDRVHPGPAGYTARARMVAETMSQCVSL